MRKNPGWIALLALIALAGCSRDIGPNIGGKAGPDGSTQGSLPFRGFAQEALVTGPFTGQYYSDMNLSNLVATRSDAAIDFNWGAGSPIAGVGVDNFSVRWTGTVGFSQAGSYRFTATADDGVRVYVDGALVIDRWIDQSATTYNADVTLAAGNHEIKMEYYENGGDAVARLSWAANSVVTPPVATGTFTGQYYSDMNLTNLVATRSDPAIDFDWGAGSPIAGVGVDNFSVRWTGTFGFSQAGSYRFTTTADDGVRVYVDGALVIDRWIDQGPTTYTADVTLAAGNHEIKMEYYENTGGAVARLSWAANAVSPVPPVTPPVAGPTPYGGLAAAIPGTLEAENYDLGGEGVAYHDTDVANQGAGFRTNESVDVRATQDAGGGYQVGWTAAGEWLIYTVNVATAGNYQLGIRASNGAQANGVLHMELDGMNFTGSVAISPTGSWDIFNAFAVGTYQLPAGQHQLKVVIEAGGFDINSYQLASVVAVPYVPGTVDVLTNRMDNGRSGTNTAETALNVGNVNMNGFGKLMSRSVDGQIYAQPLVVSNYVFTTAGNATVTRNAVIVATMHNTISAFDADDPSISAPFWSVNLGPSVPTADWGAGYNDIAREVGILSTPVIDRAKGLIYVVAASKENGAYFHRLHALELASGREMLGGPVVIGGSVPGTGEGAVNGIVTFDSFWHIQRAGLLLTGGQVVMAFASHGDARPYHGWIMSHDATTLARIGIQNTSPNTSGSGIWQAGTGLTSDDQGNVYAVAGNGFGADPSKYGDLTESIIHYTMGATSLGLADWFTPSDWQYLDDTDQDVGCDGALLIPGTQLLLAGAKSGKFYLLNRGNLGHLVPGDTQIVQEFQAAFSQGGSVHIHGTPIYWKGPSGPHVYVWAEDDYGRSYAFNGATLSTQAESTTTMTAPLYSMPGGITAISANGSNANSGVLWANLVDSGDANQATRPGILRAFDATNLGVELWNSEQNAGRDRLGNFAKFVPPTVANGKVYMATFSNQLVVYGLLHP